MVRRISSRLCLFESGQTKMIRDSGGKNKKQNFELMGKKEGKKSRVVERDGQDQSSIYMFILVFPRLSTAARDNVGKFWVLFFV